VASSAFKPFSSKSAIVCRDLGKVWGAGTPRAHEALRGIDIDIAPGVVVVLRQIHPALCARRA